MVVDCDVHPTVPGMAALLPYLDDHWREARLAEAKVAKPQPGAAS